MIGLRWGEGQRRIDHVRDLAQSPEESLFVHLIAKFGCGRFETHWCLSCCGADADDNNLVVAQVGRHRGGDVDHSIIRNDVKA